MNTTIVVRRNKRGDDFIVTRNGKRVSTMEIGQMSAKSWNYNTPSMKMNIIQAWINDEMDLILEDQEMESLTIQFIK